MTTTKTILITGATAGIGRETALFLTKQGHHVIASGRKQAELAKLAAEATGGKFYREENLHELPDDVKSQLAPFTRRTETILWNKWAMALLIGLLTLEWVLRKFNSLS